MPNPPKVLEKYKCEYLNNTPKDYVEFKKKEKVIVKIKIKNSGMDEGKIREVLKKTDNKVLKYVTSIIVHDAPEIPKIITDKHAWGTAVLNYKNCKLNYVNIHIVSSKFHQEFEHTLKHELGHVVGAMISPEKRDSEEFADDYANGHTKILIFERYKDLFLFLFGFIAFMVVIFLIFITISFLLQYI